MSEHVEQASELGEQSRGNSHDGVNGCTRRRRPWYRLHASTYVGMFLAGTVLFFVNVPGQYVPYVDFDGQEQYSIEFNVEERIEHGWPWCYLRRNEWPTDWDWNSGTPPSPVSVWSLGREVIEFRWQPLAADAAFAVVLSALSAAGFEYWRGQRHRLFQLRLSDLLVATGVIACAIAYGLKVARDFESEQAALIELGFPPLEVLRDHYANPPIFHGGYDCSRGGPSWLRELMPQSFPLWFDRVIQIERDTADQHSKLRKFPRLLAVRLSSSAYRADDIAALAELYSLEAIEFNYFYPWPSADSDSNSSDIDCDAEFARGLRQLAKLPRLAAIDVTESTFGDQCAAAIADFSRLRVLDAHETILTDNGLRHLARLERLEELHLDGTDITNEGLSYLRNLIGLRKLFLNATYATDTCLEDVGQLTSLRELDLRSTSIKGLGFKYLRNLTNLQSLSLDKDVDREAIEELRRNLPALKVFQ